MMASWKRCPRSSCDDYGKRLVLDAGAHERTGELTVAHTCLGCGYVEYGPSNPDSARKTSAIVAAVAERNRQARLAGWVIPLRKDVPDVKP